MASTAPVPLILEKLKSPTEAVRIVALLHAAAHGTGAVSLAPTIARMFEDSSAAVQWHAMRTFYTVGTGATDAVPVLVEHLRKGEPARLMTRALTALAVIGPSARSALEPVMRKWETTSGHERGQALGALLGIALDDPTVRAILIEALYSEDYSVASQARDFLVRAPDEIIDWILPQLSAPDPATRHVLGNVLAAIVTRRSETVVELVGPLLDRISEPCIWPAILAVSELPRPLSASLLRQIIRIAGEDEDENHARGALDLLAELGPAAAHAKPAILAQLATHANSMPLGGDLGRSSYVFGSAAIALANTCPRAKDAAPVLMTWLSRIPELKWPEGETPNWYTIGDVALAAAKLGPHSDLLNLVFDIARESRRWLHQDEFGVIDFERKLRDIALALGDPPALWSKLESLGIAQVEIEDERDEVASESETSELPEFPPEEIPTAAPRVEPLPEPEFRVLADLFREGETFASVSAAAAPIDIATAVDVTIRRKHRAHEMMTTDEAMALGALWGNAISQITGWGWAYVVQGETKSICLVSNDKAYACAPLVFLKAQSSPKRETTALLLFNLVNAGDLPDSAPGRLVFVR